MLGITILFTLTGAASPFAIAPRLSPALAIAAIVSPFLLAGITCIVRKRVFVEEQ